MSNVLSNLENNVLTITINRPDKLNALNQATLKELDTIINHAKDDDNTAAIIITGSGDKAFVAGADISCVPVKTFLVLQ